MTVNHYDSLIIISKKAEVEVLRIPALDSLFQITSMGPISVTTLNDTTRRLYFTFTNDQYAYKDYRLDYDSRSYLIREMRMHVRQAPDASLGMSETGVLSIVFWGYSTTPVGQNYFDENQYIIRSGSTFSVHPDYTGYEILNNTAN
ncbi:MAG: hypothetical protein B7Z54_06860 [Sphingobacteriales bacterium 12-47-4]|nr:MAG: hypothetical protein B7Z54_06860 [Sphingobacteriales bacterium 12-47-4]